MATSYYISRRVIDTINSLPLGDRVPISNALTSELILGEDPAESLSPMQGMLYAMIKFYVMQDTERHRESTPGENTPAPGPAAAKGPSFEPRRCALG